MSREEALMHFGIKGMKWGKRKVRKVQPEPNYSDDHVKKQSLKGKKMSEMSNAELKSLNERLQLERTYKDLNRKDVATGKSFVEKQLSTAGNQVATTIVTAAAMYTAKAVITKAFGEKTSDVLMPKKKK